MNKKVTKRTALERVAECIRQDCIRYDDGTFLGSEDELLERYDASRPTLRHAAAVVAQEQLLTIRRGVGGGYFSRQPSSSAVAHIAAMYLRSRKASVQDLVEAVTPLRVELAVLACRNDDPNGLEAVRAFIEDDNRISSTGCEPDKAHLAQREFFKLLGEASGNSLLALFLEIIVDLTSQLQSDLQMFFAQPERANRYREQRNRLATAVLERDEELARIEARRLSQLTVSWILEDSEFNADDVMSFDLSN